MISHPLLYLLSLASLSALFYFLESQKRWRLFTLVPSILFIYASSLLLASLGLFDTNEEIEAIYIKTKSNLLPAMLFLMLLQVDFKEFIKLRRSLGCACSMGAKRYWLLILLSLGVSFLTQFGALQYSIINTTITAALLATLFGIIGSFTRLRFMNGSKEVANSMLYLIVALLGSQTHLMSRLL